MRESATGSVSFAAVGPLPMEFDFLGGRFTGDGGLVWIAEVDADLGLTAALAAVIPGSRSRRSRVDAPRNGADREVDIRGRGHGRRLRSDNGRCEAAQKCTQLLYQRERCSSTACGALSRSRPSARALPLQGRRGPRRRRL